LEIRFNNNSLVKINEDCKISFSGNTTKKQEEILQNLAKLQNTYIVKEELLAKIIVSELAKIGINKKTEVHNER